MNSIRRLIFLGVALAATQFVLGCAPITKALYKDNTYTENVSSVLVSQDGGKLIFVGKSYHYIFDLPPAVASTLAFAFHRSVIAMMSGFAVDENNGIKGSISLKIPRDAPEGDQNAALSAGYQKSNLARGGEIFYVTELTGQRFDSGNLVIPSTQQKLNATYEVSITAPLSLGEKAIRAPLTPLTLAADGTIILIATPVVAVVMGTFILCPPSGPTCHLPTGSH